MHVFLRRAALFIFPLLLIGGILAAFFYALPEKRGRVAVPVVQKAKAKEAELPMQAVPVKDEAASAQAASGSYISVVIDPAHGGEDSGSIGANSVMSSHINLQVAFKLARAMRMKGMKVFLTRMDDYNVSLERRIGDAQKQSPAIYISLDCAYSDNKNKKGMEIYAFTPERSGDELERQLNRSYDFHEGRYVAKSQEAEEVEEEVFKSLKREFNLPYRARLERRFIKSLSLPESIPALLVHMGYISNSEEANWLSSEKDMDDWAESFAGAVDESFIRRPKVAA